MSCLTRDAILQAQKIKVHQVPTPEGGDGSFVCIREFSGKDRESFGRAVPEETTNSELYRIACVFGLCDPDGKRLFALEDLALMAELNSALFDRLGKKIIELNEASRKAIDDAKKD